MPRARLFAIVLLASSVACSSERSSFTSPTAVSRVGIAQVNANRDAYVGQRIEVEGRIDVQAVEATLHVVVPGEARSRANSLDLYEVGVDGLYVPARCRVVTEATFDCGSLRKDAVTTLQGSFVKILQGDRRLGPGPGQLFLFEEIYFLVVTR